MDCEKFEKHIYDYFTNPVFDWKLREELDFHYFECERCFETYRVTKIMADKRIKALTLDKLVGDLKNRAITNFKKGMINEAVSELNQALLINPEDIVLRQKKIKDEEENINQEKIFYMLKKYKEINGDDNIKGVFAKLINPEDIVLRLKFLKIFFLLGKEYKDENLKIMAIAECKKLQKAEPHNIKVYGVLAEFYFFMKENKKAIETLQKAQQIDPVDLNTNLTLGTIFLDQRETDKAITELEKAYKKDTANLLTIQLLAWAFFIQGKNDKAIAFCNRFLKIDPINTNVLSCRAKAYKVKKLYKDAIIDCNQIINLQPKDIQSYNLKAQIFLEKQMIDEVIAESQKALSIIPDNPRANLNLGVAYFIKSEHDLSYDKLEKVQNSTLEYPIAAIFRSFIKMERGDFGEALILIDEYLDEYPKDAIAIISKGQYLEKLGHYEDALKFYEKALDLIIKANNIISEGEIIIENLRQEIARVKAYTKNGKIIPTKVQFHCYEIEWIVSILDKNEIIAPKEFYPSQLSLQKNEQLMLNNL